MICPRCDGSGIIKARTELLEATAVCGRCDGRGEIAASCDTLPKGQDAKQGLAGTESGAVPEGQTPNLPTPSGEHNHG